jgi:hypothetical protein
VYYIIGGSCEVGGRRWDGNMDYLTVLDGGSPSHRGVAHPV